MKGNEVSPKCAFEHNYCLKIFMFAYGCQTYNEKNKSNIKQRKLPFNVSHMGHDLMHDLHNVISRESLDKQRY